MAPGRHLIVLLLLVTPAVAGCMSGPSDDGNATDGPGDGATDGGDGNGADGADGDGTDDGPQARKPVPPRQQRVDDPDDVDQPGEYAILPRGADPTQARWDVPQWSVGDKWVYSHTVTANAVTVKTEEEVTATATTWETPIYQIVRTDHECDPAARSCAKTVNITQEDLVEISDSGYVEHAFVFPLEDGKRWLYARDDGQGGVTRVVAEARHVPEYLRPNSTEIVEAWRIVLDFDSKGNVQTKTWLGVAAENMLRREIWADGADGVQVMHFATRLDSYTHA